MLKSPLHNYLFSFQHLHFHQRDLPKSGSRGQLKQLKQQLDNWTKGSKAIEEYVQGFTNHFDCIAVLGKPINHEDRIIHINVGLPEEYRSMADQIESPLHASMIC